MGVKYEFKKVENSLDDFEFIYEKNGKKNVIPFKRNLKAVKMLQGVTAKARTNLFMFLTEKGKTKNDFIVKTTNEKGEIKYDETNFRELENGFIQEEMLNTINEIVEEMLKMNMVELITELELSTEEEGIELSTKLLATINEEDNKKNFLK